MDDQWWLRQTEVADLPELLELQERGAVVGLGHIFSQDTFPFPREAVEQRWRSELADPAVACYVGVHRDGPVVGFAARRGSELLHFGTAVHTWGSGLAGWLHDAVVRTYPRELPELRLRVFADNARARRFYERRGWRPTGAETRSSFAPHPVLVDYVLDRTAHPGGRGGRPEAQGEGPCSTGAVSGGDDAKRG